MLRPRLPCVPRFFVPLLVLAALLSARSAFAQEGSAPPSLKLDNGLTVLLREDGTRPEVAIQLDFNVGSDDDPAGAEGSAWLVAQYLARPTNRMFNAEKQEALFRALGAGAFLPTPLVSRSHTVLGLVVPASETELQLYGLSQALAFAAEAAPWANWPGICATVEAEHEADWRGPEDNLFATLVQVALRPAQSPVFPTVPDTCTAAVQPGAFFKNRLLARYGMKNAVLSIAGGIHSAAVEDVVRHYFGALPGGTFHPRHDVVPGPLVSEKRLDFVAAIDRPRVDMVWSTAAYLEANDPVLDVLAEVIRARLCAPLLTRELAKVCHAQQFSSFVGSTFQLRAVVGEGHTPDELRSAIDVGLRELETSLTETEVLAARSRRTVDLLSRQALSASSQADWSRACWQVKGAKCFDRYVARTRTVDLETVRRVALEELALDRRIVAITQTDSAAPAVGRLKDGQAERNAGQLPSDRGAPLSLVGETLTQTAWDSPPKPGSQPAFSWPTSETLLLRNGVRVVVAPASGEVVQLGVLVRWENTAKRSRAEQDLLYAMIPYLTPRGGRPLRDALRDAGTQFAGVWSDATGFSIGVSCDGGSLPAALALIGRALAEGEIPKQELDNYVQTLKPNTGATLTEVFATWALPKLPVTGRGARGQELAGKVKARRLEDLLHQAASAQATSVIAVGKVEGSVLRAAAERALGRLAKAPQWLPQARPTVAAPGVHIAPMADTGSVSVLLATLGSSPAPDASDMALAGVLEGALAADSVKACGNVGSAVDELPGVSAVTLSTRTKPELAFQCLQQLLAASEALTSGHAAESRLRAELAEMRRGELMALLKPWTVNARITDMVALGLTPERNVELGQALWAMTATELAGQIKTRFAKGRLYAVLVGQVGEVDVKAFEGLGLSPVFVQEPFEGAS